MGQLPESLPITIGSPAACCFLTFARCLATIFAGFSPCRAPSLLHQPGFDRGPLQQEENPGSSTLGEDALSAVRRPGLQVPFLLPILSSNSFRLSVRSPACNRQRLLRVLRRSSLSIGASRQTQHNTIRRLDRRTRVASRVLSVGVSVVWDTRYVFTRFTDKPSAARP